MNTDPKAKDLFIVDNSVSGWTALRYLEEWCSIAKSFDIATGNFEIGSLLALDGKWQTLDKIRILMGAETTLRTRKALLEAVRTEAVDVLDQSLESAKAKNPFLNGVPGILEALRGGQIECRVYDKAKFHAKAYITHAKLEVVGAQALVGSSNFSAPGLTQNIELNVQIQSAREVAQLQEWFDAHWNEATDVTPTVVDTVDRHTRLYSPFEVYAKALQEYFKGHELTANEWDETVSRVFPKLDRYQKEAYWALMKIARQHNGAFLCDGVGLGKTFVGLMLIERLVVHENKRVVLFAPKAAKDGVWEPHLRQWLPHIGGVGGNAVYSSLAVFSHTDLGREGDFPEVFQRIAEQADVVIIDEAHHFRNPGRQGGDDDRAPSRYFRMFDLLDQTTRAKQVYLLTATPINNRLSDFRHMAELFTRRDDAFFAKTLGVNNLTAHFNQLEKSLRNAVGHDVATAADHLPETQQLLEHDSIFQHLVVQRSRAYARESQIREKGKAAAFPDRRPPQVAEYSIKKTYGKLLDLFENAFTRKNPLFTLPQYYPLHWYRGPDKSIDPLEQGRQQQVVGLIRTNFLKRFESSVTAFELSCHRLMQKLLAFLTVHCETTTERAKLDKFLDDNADLLGYVRERQRLFWDDDDSDDEDVVPLELLDAVERLPRADYNVGDMVTETFHDLKQLVHFLAEARSFKPKHDDKLQKLISLLTSKALAGQKVLVFTEFADTARYLKRELVAAGVDGVAQVDSGTKEHRAQIIQRFAPYYNGSSTAALEAKGLQEIRVLISTDVLSEGLNLQDASRMINYDIHWNPVRLMQRIGRVDRRMNPEVEERLKADHPGVAASRGTVSYWNFLPPDELNAILTLYTKVTQKTLLISKTLGIEGRKLLHPDELYDDLKVLRGFESEYEGTRTAVENLHLEYQALIQADPTLDSRLRMLPGAVFSGRQRVSQGAAGVFFCYALPALDREAGEFTESAGTTRWYLYDVAKGSIHEEAGDIAAQVRSTPDTPRNCTTPQERLVEVRTKVGAHIKNSYLRRVDAPAGVKPALRCWMELNEG